MDKKRPLHQFDLSKLQNSTAPVIKDRTLSEGFAPIKNATENIDTKSIQKIVSPSDVAGKIAAFRAAKALGKKALGVIPFAGAGMAALSGEPAMAAEELATDLAGPAGAVYEAIKPTNAGPAQGSMDERIESGTLTDEDKALLKQQALQRMR